MVEMVDEGFSKKMERFFEEEWKDGEAGEGSRVWEGGRGGWSGRVDERFLKRVGR